MTDQFAATDDAVSAGGVRHNHAPAHEAPPHVVPLDVVPLDVTDNDDVPAGVTNIDDVPAGVTDNDDVLAGVTDNDDGLDDVTDVDDGLDEDVSYGWHRWAAISLLRGTPAANVITTMTDEGVLESDAAATVARLFTDPVFEAGKWAMQQLRKLESVVAMRQQMEALDPRPVEIDRRSGLSREEFLHEYYALNRPVVLGDLCDEWPARSRWSPEFLAETFADAEVEVMTGRENDTDYEVNANAHRSRMPFDEYVAKVLATEWSNDLYLVANNKLLESSIAAPLWNDFTLDSRYMKRDSKRKLTYLWFGPAGTVTKLHHDLMNILFHQVDGWKQFILISPLETPNLSNMVGVYSDVDPQAPDLARFPRYEGVRQLQFSVGPGEAVFIPVGWWHHVTALETSISVSSTSFVFPNTIPWANPTKIL